MYITMLREKLFELDCFECYIRMFCLFLVHLSLILPAHLALARPLVSIDEGAL